MAIPHHAPDTACPNTLNRLNPSNGASSDSNSLLFPGLLPRSPVSSPPRLCSFLQEQRPCTLFPSTSGPMFLRQRLCMFPYDGSVGPTLAFLPHQTTLHPGFCTRYLSGLPLDNHHTRTQLLPRQRRAGTRLESLRSRMVLGKQESGTDAINFCRICGKFFRVVLLQSIFNVTTDEHRWTQINQQRARSGERGARGTSNDGEGQRAKGKRPEAGSRRPEASTR